MFDPILVPLDGSPLAESALPQAAAIARHSMQKSCCCTSWIRTEWGASTQVFDLLNWQIKKTEAKLYLERIE